MSDLIGANQAEAMLRRVSPEGRERAARERQRRHQRTVSLVGRIVLAALIALAAIGVSFLILGEVSGAVVGAIFGMFVVAAVVITASSRERPVRAVALPDATLPALPSATAAWLEDQHLALPAPALPLADSIGARLQELAPQLARLGGEEPAADAVRRLLATELPDLIERHRSVPARLRSEPQSDGFSADAHLLNGLRIVDEEVARITAELAAGDVDALATRDRFLELKYQAKEMGRR